MNYEKVRMSRAVNLTVHCESRAVKATKLATNSVQLRSLKLHKLIEMKHKVEL